jgi:Predicted membrane protein (DUF2306)
MLQRGNVLVLGAPTVIALWFISGFAVTYLTDEPTQFGIYWPRHQWLLAHVIAGMIALLSGPAQLWLGINCRAAIVHRLLGILYVAAVVVSGTCAYYLAAHTDFGWMFGMGLISMASAWLITTLLAIVAICLRRIEQHREWMIRSYVVTFGFVTFRVLDEAMDIARMGSVLERKAVAAWLAWTAPLFLTECVLQGRKIFARQVSAVPLPDASAYTVAPGPRAFDLRNSESSYQHQR